MRELIYAVSGFLVFSCASEAQRPKPNAPPKPDVTVTVQELQKDYTDNEIAAERKYRLKLLEVTGRIKEIGRVPMSSSTQIGFETEGDIMILAHFLKDNEDLVLKVKRGDTVTVIGNGAGLTKDKKLYITRCTALKKAEERKD
jgi:hypothetical protein